MAATLAQSFALVLRLWRAEGARSLLDRWLDRRLDARRAARFRVLPGATPGAGSQTLWVLPFALHRRRGGAAIQLLVRLEELARDRPVALLHRLPDRLRCEVWGHGAGSPLAREWPVPAPEAWAAIVIEAARWARAFACATRTAASAASRSLLWARPASIRLFSPGERKRSHQRPGTSRVALSD